ncbi:MAG: TVP38/TMEM64 family protein [Asgard group archaeon]|nr:TVP38/TMEM64 family protein [Asgard group archaeon]
MESVSKPTESTLSQKEETNSTEDDKKPFTWTKDKILLAVIFSIIMLISVGLLIMIFIDDEFLFLIVRDYFIRPIIFLPVWVRVLLFLLIMVVQSLFAPIPSEIILLSGGMIFGLWWGTLIGVVGSMLSAAITYYISKRGGRSIIDASGEKIKLIDRTIFIFDEWIKRWGLWAILLGRAIPMIMFDPVSYAAGLAKIKDKYYFLATFIGSIPRAIFYSFLGVKLLDNQPIEYILDLTPTEVNEVANQFNLIFFIIFGILVVIFILSNVLYYWRENRKKKQEVETDEEKEVTETKPTESNELPEQPNSNDTAKI